MYIIVNCSPGLRTSLQHKRQFSVCFCLQSKILEGSSPARPTRLPHIPNLDPKSHTFDLDTLFNIIKAHSGLERVPRKRGFWMPFLGASPPKRSRVPRESPASPPRVPRKPQRISCESPASPLHRLRFHTRTDDCRSLQIEQQMPPSNLMGCAHGCDFGQLSNIELP